MRLLWPHCFQNIPITVVLLTPQASRAYLGIKADLWLGAEETSRVVDYSNYMFIVRLLASRHQVQMITVLVMRLRNHLLVRNAQKNMKDAYLLPAHDPNAT
jgi:hypothetical protein